MVTQTRTRQLRGGVPTVDPSNTMPQVRARIVRQSRLTKSNQRPAGDVSHSDMEHTCAAATEGSASMSIDASCDAHWPRSDEDLYVAVTTVWCRMFLQAERRKHPLGPYVLGEGFTRSVARAPIDALRVAAVCARVVCRHTHGDRESWPVDLLPRETLDPAAAWWCAIEEPDGFGVHHVELGGGALELLSVAYFDDRPNLRTFSWGS